MEAEEFGCLSSSWDIIGGSRSTISEVRRPQWPTIMKVPLVIRTLDEAAFEPQLVSIGPYHREKPHLKAMNECKLQYRQKFLARHPADDPAMRLKETHQRIHHLLDRAKKCYVWGDVGTLEDDEFIELLILDGCFILELLLLRNEGRWHRVDRLRRWKEQAEIDPILDVNWAINPLYYDMLKLENQLPFFVLKSLYEDISGPSLESLVQNFLSSSSVFANCSHGDVQTDVYHMLHYWHKCLTGNPQTKQQHDLQADPERNPTAEELAGLKSKSNNASRPQKDLERIPTAQELLEAGLKLKSNNAGKLLEVAFTQGGVLEMAPLIINEYTSTLFHNLVAFEQSCPEVGEYVSGYCHFIDCLIDTPTDVRLLRQAKVVRNHIGSDEEVAVLVNRLCKHVNFTSLPLSMVCRDINNYCNHRWPRWRAKLVRDYFSNPWAIISLVAAIALLLFTAVQVVFAVISYVRPPK